jgi:hypothetical protein
MGDEAASQCETRRFDGAAKQIINHIVHAETQ